MTKAEAYKNYNRTMQLIRSQKEAEDRLYIRNACCDNAGLQYDPYTDMGILAQKALDRELVEAEETVPGNRFNWKRAAILIKPFYGDGTLYAYDMMKKAIARRDKKKMREAVGYAAFTMECLPVRFLAGLEATLAELDGMLAAAGA